MINIPQNPRKLKRFLENEKYAAEAKYWSKYKTSTSTFLSDCHPKFVKTEKETQKPPKFVVYFIRATAKNSTYSFLKIGISGYKEIRFDFDSHRFSFAALSTIECSSRKEAAKIESRLLNKFKEYKCVPKLRLLSGGNSECFHNTQIIQDLIYNEFCSILGISPKTEPEFSISPRLHDLLLMSDLKDYEGWALEQRLRNFRGALKALEVKVPKFEELLDYYLRKIKYKKKQS